MAAAAHLRRLGSRPTAALSQSLADHGSHRCRLGSIQTAMRQLIQLQTPERGHLGSSREAGFAGETA